MDESGRATTTSRRRILAGVLAVTAGCGGTPSESTPEPLPYRHLESEPLYVGETVEAAFPDGVGFVSEPTAATLAVLGRETAVDGGRVGEWLTAGVAVAVAGRPARPTLWRLLTSGGVDESFTVSFDPDGGSESYLVAAVDPVDDRRLVPIFADSEFQRPVTYAVDDVLRGVVEG
ncbi:hypothetical protein [Halobaculum sp. MBLA0143]|uniref:hypothetical protein n=1 Tax=Halobaculum sp. MBLA0143 TaxID=3079933 RepID=UPI00352358F3